MAFPISEIASGPGLLSDLLRQLWRMSRVHRKDISEAIEALYRLNVGVIGTGTERHERPHKPILLLAVIDLVAEGDATPECIPWSQKLRARFSLYFEMVRQLNDQCTPENPLFYLRQEKWWLPFRQDGQVSVPLEGTPTVAQASGGVVFAKITSPIANWIITPADRLCLREALIARYFPHAREVLSPHFMEGSVQEASPAAESDDDANVSPGRSVGFRRKILDIYDCQCAACGLRIKLPEIADFTFVDAAHLIPFSDPELGRNDHPTNGIALCKNHHWAMYRFLIAPSPAGVWKVSPTLVARRSPGERELLDLQNEPVLKPSERAFYPAEAALAWRCERLVA
jgi:putative restriction endonuclease